MKNINPIAIVIVLVAAMFAAEGVLLYKKEQKTKQAAVEVKPTPAPPKSPNLSRFNSEEIGFYILITDTKTGNEYLYRHGAIIQLNK